MIGRIVNAFMEEHPMGFYKCYDTVDRGHGMDFRSVYGTQAHIMQSSSDVDKVIPMFEAAVAAGLHPEDVEQDIYRQAGVNPADFTEFDKERILKRVNEIYSAQNSFYDQRG